MVKCFKDKKVVAVLVGSIFMGTVFFESKSFTITSQQLQQDTPAIKKYILKEVADKIAQSQEWYVTKTMACTFGNISEKVYDSRPIEFFKDKKEAELALDKQLADPKAADRIQDGVNLFLKKGLSVNDNNLGEFFFDRAVDRLKLNAESKALLKQDPSKLDAFVKSKVVERSEYMKIISENLTQKYYLEKKYK